MHSTFIHLLSSIVIATGLLRVHAATYTQSTSYIGNDFISGDFNFFTAADPTAGRVYVLFIYLSPSSSTESDEKKYRTYVDQATAAAANLTFATDDVFVLRADDTTVLSASDPGRKSVRLESVLTFGSPSAMVYVQINKLLNDTRAKMRYRLDIAHMPEGCGYVFL